MVKINSFFKEIILMIIFILIVIFEFYLIQLNQLYAALIDGIIAFIIGLYLMRSLIKKIKLRL
jgi:divalent metal cation (Fe/Co/Zn/Cd) transporter